MTVVLAFGTFDPLHDGHRSFLTQAAGFGDQLQVVAARDSAIRSLKQREPRVSAARRWQALQQERTITHVQWGDEWPTTDPYRLLRELSFDVLALGYDQEPSNEEVHALLAGIGKPHVRVVRLSAHQAEEFKSSYSKS